jgi:hypothetical protein
MTRSRNNGPDAKTLPSGAQGYVIPRPRYTARGRHTGVRAVVEVEQMLLTV